MADGKVYDPLESAVLQQRKRSALRFDTKPASYEWAHSVRGFKAVIAIVSIEADSTDMDWGIGTHMIVPADMIGATMVTGVATAIEIWTSHTGIETGGHTDAVHCD